MTRARQKYRYTLCISHKQPQAVCLLLLQLMLHQPRGVIYGIKKLGMISLKMASPLSHFLLIGKRFLWCIHQISIFYFENVCLKNSRV